MKLKQLRTFLIVAETGSIHAGARLLGVSQPAVSTAIRGLEQMLDAPLFRRSSNGIELTEYGHAFARRARALVEDMRRAQEEIGQMKHGGAGTVTLAMAATASARVYVPTALERFKRTMPHVAIELTDGTWQQVIDQLVKGIADFAMVQAPANLDYPESIEVVPLNALPLIVGVRDTHPLRNVRSLGRLTDSTWLLPGRLAPSTETRFVELFERHGLRPPSSIIRCQSSMTALALMQKMDFVSLFAAPMAAEDFPRYGLRKVKVREPLPALAHSLLKRREPPLTTAAAHFFQCLLEACREDQT